MNLCALLPLRVELVKNQIVLSAAVSSFTMYFGGYKRILFDSVVASILTPVLILLAAHGLIASVLTFTGILICLYYASSVVKKQNRTVPFFFIWFITSIVYIFISFEFFVSSLLMMSSSENFLFLSLISLAVYCLIYAKCLSSQICQPPATSKGDILLSSDDKDVETGSRKRSNLAPDLCPLFGMLPVCKASRCFICRASTLSKQLYCQWLDCQISSKNFDFYIMGLSFLVCGLFFYTYLIWTSACHCHLLFSVLGIDIYFPDDCSDVFYDLLVAVCFASSLHSQLLAWISVYVLVTDLSFFVRSSPSITNRLTGNRIRLS